MNILILLLLITIFAFELALFKDVIAPPVFMTIIWMLPFLWLSVGNVTGSISYVMDSAGMIYVFGVIVFLVGFSISCKKYRYIDYNEPIAENHCMTRVMKMIILVEAAVLLYFLFDVLSFVINNMRGSFWYTYKWGMNNNLYRERWFVSYGRNASRAITIVIYAFANTTKGNNEKKERKWVIAQVIVAAVFHVIGPGRNDIFALLIPLGIIYICTHRKSAFDSVSKIMKLCLLLLVVFFVYYVFKNPNRDSTGGGIDSIENYLCGGSVSFIEWINQGNHQYGHGTYTFRFFLALARDAFGIKASVVSPVEERILNFNGHTGNVYTVYKWYANDFGLWYAFLWQFFIGCIHGRITRRFQEKQNTVTLIVFALSFFPLFMQFFQDEYISIFSTWIQMLFWVFLCANTNILYRRMEEKNT